MADDRAAGPGGRTALPSPRAGHPAAAEAALIAVAGLGPAARTITPGVPVRLTRTVRRLTAPNAGAMTGPGTNSYLLGNFDDCAVIDPGPAHEGHVAALLEAGGRIKWILATHTHSDHSPAAALLKERTGATLLGLPPPAGGLQDRSFQPDRVLAHGEHLALPGGTLRVIHTPGHASNHLCYLLEDERLLFTGDHVMQGSTVVINPPDGNMAAYIGSLRLLTREPIDHFAPGHGFLIGRPMDMVDLLLRHRFAREARVLGAVRTLGPASLETLTPVVYDDVPAAKHPWAARSLLAHLLKLANDGAVAEQDGLWVAVRGIN